MHDASVELGTVLETHGTGTALGDPIEISAISAVASNFTMPCSLSAIKGIVGHMESSAGVGGTLKMVSLLIFGEGT